MTASGEDYTVHQFAQGGCSSATDLLKTALVPRKNSCAPPNFHQDSNFNKKLDFVLNFDTTTPPGPLGPVSRQDGMILWLVNYGANSMFHMGFVPAGTYISSPLFPGLPTPNDGLPHSIILGHFLGITYTAPLALPYNMRQSTENQITIAPDLSQNFSKTRMTSGVIDIKSSTVPGGAVNLNGLLAAGSLSDTRDIAQNTTTGSGPTAYSITDLAQSSVTKKDGLKEVAIYDGVASILGPDIPPDYTAPNINDTFQRNGQYYVASISNKTDVTLTNTAISDVGLFFPIATGIISPWRVSAQFASVITLYPAIPTPAQVYNQIWTDPIDETGSLAFIFTGKYRFSNITGALDTPNNLYEIKLLLSHLYASVDNDGKIFHYQIDEIHKIDAREQWQDTFNFPGEFLYETFTVKSEPDFQTQSFAGDTSTGTFQGGKYIGTTFELCTGLTRVATAVIGQSMKIETLEFNVSIIAPSVAVRGAVGPARVIRYDNVSTGQNLRINGMANVQCIPQGSLAPFTQTSAMFNRESVDVNVMPWLAAMFNGPLPISRNWTLSDYEEMMKKIDQIASTEGLLQMGKMDSKAGSAMQAAGLFSKIGGLAGTLMGGPAGGALGGLIGGVGDSIFGARGQFGGGSGMASAGSFRAMSGYEAGARRGRLD